LKREIRHVEGLTTADPRYRSCRYYGGRAHAVSRPPMPLVFSTERPRPLDVTCIDCGIVLRLCSDGGYRSDPPPVDVDAQTPAVAHDDHGVPSAISGDYA